jgi:hypothetical protein
MQQFILPNKVDWRPTSLIAAWLSLSYENAKPKVEMKVANISYVSDVIPVMEGAVSAQ